MRNLRWVSTLGKLDGDRMPPRFHSWTSYLLKTHANIFWQSIVFHEYISNIIIARTISYATNLTTSRSSETQANVENKLSRDELSFHLSKSTQFWQKEASIITYPWVLVNRRELCLFQVSSIVSTANDLVKLK